MKTFRLPRAGNITNIFKKETKSSKSALERIYTNFKAKNKEVFFIKRLKLSLSFLSGMMPWMIRTYGMT